MKFMIQKLQILIYDNNTSIHLKKLFNGVVLNYDTRIENDKVILNNVTSYFDEDYKVDLANLAKKIFLLTQNNKLKLLGFTEDMITDLKNSPAPAAPEPDTSNPAETQSAPAETQSAAPAAAPAETQSAAPATTVETPSPEIVEIYNAVKDVGNDGKFGENLLNDVVETKMQNLKEKIKNVNTDLQEQLVNKLLADELAKTYTFDAGDGNTNETTIYDYVADKYDSDPPLNENQKDQLSLVMVTLLMNMGWKKSQAKPGTYVNDYGLREPGNMKSLPNLRELYMVENKRNWKLQSTEQYGPMIANMRDNDFDEPLKQLNTLIRSKLSGIKGITNSRKQASKIDYLNRVKAEIKNTQGLSQDNINTLKMTIVVWKVLSMTPVNVDSTPQLPDQYLVESVGDGDVSKFSTNLESIMNVLDDDEKWDFLTEKNRFDDGNLYLLEFSDSDAEEPETPTKSLLIFINETVTDTDTKNAMLDQMESYFDDKDGAKSIFNAFITADQAQQSAQSDEGNMFGILTGMFRGGRKLRKTKKKKANKKKNRKTRSKKSKNQRKKK